MDVKTIFLLLGLGNFLLTVLFMSFGTTKNKMAKRLWIGAKFIEAIVYLAFCINIITNSTQFYWVENALLYTGFALEAAALWEYQQYKKWTKIILPFLILTISIRACAEVMGLPASLKIAISSYIVGIFFLISTVAFIPRGREATLLNKIVITTNSIPIIGNFVRGTMSFFAVDNTLGSGNLINMITYLAMYVFMITNGFGFLLLIRDDTERELINLATIDPLTELVNRRAFYEYADDYLIMSRRMASNMILMVFDIDYFKKINDTYGHATGDLVLQSFAKICCSTLNEKDIIGRTGGEEFAAILNNCKMEEAVQIAENMRHSIEEHIFTTEIAEIRFTVSIGLLNIGIEGSLNEVMAWADEALYQAKQSGRNKVVIAEKI